MEQRLAPVGLLVLSVVAAGCAQSIERLHPPAAGTAVKPVYVINHGWHTGIAVRRADIPEGVWPEHRDMPASQYLEVGWGNRDFYVAPEGTLWRALKAAFWPTPSVLHIVGFDGPVERFFRQREIVEVLVSASGLRQLAAFIENAYAKHDSGTPIVVGPGHYANSRFYVGREKYSLLKTCNTWAAQALQSAGLPITPLYAITAANVMDRARAFGTVEKTRAK
jgi:uncharacterized protein (TIGR02117 family)